MCWKTRSLQKQQAVKGKDKGQKRIVKKVCTARKDSRKKCETYVICEICEIFNMWNISKSDRDCST